MVSKVKEINVSNVDKVKYCFDNLDLSELNKKVGELLNDPTFKFEKTFRVTQNGNTAYINIKSDKNLVKDCGILQLGLKSVLLQDFGTHVLESVVYDKNDNIVESTFRLHIVIDARYEIRNGGSNGITILVADYFVEDKRWEFYMFD